MIRVEHGCGESLEVSPGELATCPRCRKRFAAYPMTQMTPQEEAFAQALEGSFVEPQGRELIDSAILDQVVRRYGELLDRYLRSFRGYLDREGLAEAEIEAEVARVRNEWAL